MIALKLARIGASTGVVIPEDMLARLNVGEGDTLYAIQLADGGYRLTPNDPDFAEKLARVDDIASRYRNALEALAR